MKDLVTWAKAIVRRTLPASIVVAAAAASLGAYPGDAATLARHKPARHTFTFSLRANAATLNPGSSRSLAIVIRRRGFRSGVAFKLTSKLPRGISVRFTPARTTGKRATLTLRASAAARLGRYSLRVQASGGHLRRTSTLSLRVVARTSASQTANGQTPDFSLAGSSTVPLEPGAPQPIDVVVTNPNNLPLSLSDLTVAVQGISAPNATSGLPCSQSDFAVQPYTGQLPLSIPASSATSLSQLGIPSSQWPEVSLVDLSTNQDGCQGASLSLTYSADARLG